MEFPYETGVVVCPRCGSEFQPHVTHCLDCGAPTQSSWALDLSPKGSAQRAFTLPPECRDAVVVRSGELEWAESFGSFLAQHGIPWRLEIYDRSDSTRRRVRYEVCVSERDLERALELEQEHLLLENPELAEEFIALPSTDQCPACGSRVSPERSECPSCGLALDGPIVDEDGKEAD